MLTENCFGFQLLELRMHTSIIGIITLAPKSTPSPFDNQPDIVEAAGWLSFVVQSNLPAGLYS